MNTADGIYDSRDEVALYIHLYGHLPDNYITKNEAQALGFAKELGFSPLRIKRLPPAKHIFTHLEWHMKAYEILTEECSSVPDDSFVIVTKKELQSLAIPSAFRVYTDWYSLR